MSEHDEQLRSAFEAEGSYFDLLRTVRNRRVAKGWNFDRAVTEDHPVTGRRMSQTDGPMKWAAVSEPQPLSELEEALIAWAACGPNGLVLWDMLFTNGFNQLADLAGRTSPSPHNTSATDIIIINDDGAWLYRPSLDRSGPVEMDGNDPDRFEKVLTWYREGRTQILDHRPDFDWAMWQDAAPHAPLSGAAQYNLNRPGSTWFLPVADAGRLMVTLLDLMSTGHKFIVDDFNGNVPAGLEEWIRPGMLEAGIPLSAQEQTILQAETYPAGALTQNVRLAAEAMGLGCWTVSGYNRDVLLGINPEISEGLGFSWAPPNMKAPMATGRMKSYGIPGLKDSTVVPGPRYADGRAVADHWKQERYGTGGWGDTSEEGLLRRGQAPWTDEVTRAIFASRGADYPEWVWDASAGYIDYCVETFGQWPVTFNPIQAHWGPIVHHVEPEFYRAKYRDGYVTKQIDQHDEVWHRVSTRRRLVT